MLFPFFALYVTRRFNVGMTQVGVLYRCDADGSHIQRLSHNPEHDNTPAVLPDGRILYTRWEYVDRSEVSFHHLWTANPDGTGQMVFYGNMQPGIAEWNLYRLAEAMLPLLETILDPLLSIYFSSPIIVIVLTFCVWKVTRAEMVDVGYTVGVGFVLLLGMDLFLLGALMGDLRPSVRRHDSSERDLQVMAASYETATTNEPGRPAIASNRAPATVSAAAWNLLLMVILEMLANVNLGRDLEVLAKKGRVVVIGSRGTVEINPRETMGRDADIRGMTLFNATPQELAGIHASIIAGLENGALGPIIGRRMSLADAAKAHEEILKPGSHGKIVLQP